MARKIRLTMRKEHAAEDAYWADDGDDPAREEKLWNKVEQERGNHVVSVSLSGAFRRNTRLW